MRDLEEEGGTPCPTSATQGSVLPCDLSREPRAFPTCRSAPATPHGPLPCQHCCLAGTLASLPSPGQPGDAPALHTCRRPVGAAWVHLAWDTAAATLFFKSTTRRFGEDRSQAQNFLWTVFRGAGIACGRNITPKGRISCPQPLPSPPIICLSYPPFEFLFLGEGMEGLGLNDFLWKRTK